MPRPTGTSRTCLRCGEFLPAGCSLSRQYCPACGRLRNLELTKARQRAAARKREEQRAADQALADREYCRECVYYGSGEYHRNLCDFMLRTGHRRGCHFGEGCERRTVP